MGYVAIRSRNTVIHEALSRQSYDLYCYDHLGWRQIRSADIKRIKKTQKVEGEGGNNLVESKRGKKNLDLKFDLILNQINIEKSQENIVVTADIKEHTIAVRVEDDDK